MSEINKKKNELDWYDNPTIITNLILLMTAIIVILSQSFAVNNGLGALEILSGILNHNIGYLLVAIYFVSLKTKTGKRYFDFLNIFLIVLYGLTSITSLLTLLQSFGLGSLLGFCIDIIILVYMIHTFLRSTRVWKSLSLGKSPFNEISNSSYFYSILVLSITLLAVNLISTTSFDGTLLALMDALYTILFVRYIFLYGEFLNSKKISINNEGNFDQYKEKVKEEVTGFVEDNKIDEKIESIKDKVSDFVDDVKEKATDIKEDIEEKIEEAKIDEKIDSATKKLSEVVEEVKEKASDIKENIEEKIEEAKIDEKIDAAKKKVSEVVEDVKDKASDIKEDIEEKIEEAKIDEKIDAAKKKVSEVVEDVKEKVTDKKKEKKVKEKPEKKFFSRKKTVSKTKVEKTNTKKGSK